MGSKAKRNFKAARMFVGDKALSYLEVGRRDGVPHNRIPNGLFKERARAAFERCVAEGHYPSLPTMRFYGAVGDQNRLNRLRHELMSESGIAVAPSGRPRGPRGPRAEPGRVAFGRVSEEEFERRGRAAFARCLAEGRYPSRVLMRRYGAVGDQDRLRRLRERLVAGDDAGASRPSRRAPETWACAKESDDYWIAWRRVRRWARARSSQLAAAQGLGGGPQM